MSACRYDFNPGWRCSREFRHLGPCKLKPKWWNVIDRWYFKGVE